MLTVPLIDTYLQMNLYKVHNLPTVHPILQVQTNCELGGKYFATLKHNMYVALPDGENIQLCIVTKGHLCLFIKLYTQLNKLNGVCMPFSFKTKTKLELQNFNQTSVCQYGL